MLSSLLSGNIYLYVVSGIVSPSPSTLLTSKNRNLPSWLWLWLLDERAAESAQRVKRALKRKSEISDLRFTRRRKLNPCHSKFQPPVHDRLGCASYLVSCTASGPPTDIAISRRDGLCPTRQQVDGAAAFPCAWPAPEKEQVDSRWSRYAPTPPLLLRALPSSQLS